MSPDSTVDLVRATVALFIIVDPIGLVPIFSNVTGNMPAPNEPKCTGSSFTPAPAYSRSSPSWAKSYSPSSASASQASKWPADYYSCYSPSTYSSAEKDSPNQAHTKTQESSPSPSPYSSDPEP